MFWFSTNYAFTTFAKHRAHAFRGVRKRGTGSESATFLFVPDLPVLVYCKSPIE